MSELKANGVRRRKKTAKKKGSKKKDPITASASSTGGDAVSSKTSQDKDLNDESRSRETLWDMAKESPMIWITAVVMIPYSLYNLYLFLFLQHPEIISLATMNNVRTRPAVRVTDPRQVLVVGSISSGTTQVSHDLKNKLGLEIGHENSEASWSFVRDGTVSWFHGIRYIPRPGIDTDEFEKDEAEKGQALFQSVVNHLCYQLHPNMGFHPFMFRDGKCSLRQKWESCWRDECKDVLNIEWGCGLSERSANTGGNRTCLTPYQKVLHQVRHPLRTIESLVTKFCIDGVEGDVQPTFLTFASVLFPQHDFSKMSCIEAAGYYVEEYNSAIMEAKVDATFLVEEMTPCDIAKLAGFADDDVLYAQNKKLVMDACKSEDSEAKKMMVSNKNRYNKGQLSLDWDDLLGGEHGSSKKIGDRDLQKRVKKLAHKLGYQ